MMLIILKKFKELIVINSSKLRGKMMKLSQETKPHKNQNQLKHVVIRNQKKRKRRENKQKWSNMKQMPKKIKNVMRQIILKKLKRQIMINSGKLKSKMMRQWVRNNQMNQSMNRKITIELKKMKLVNQVMMRWVLEIILE